MIKGCANFYTGICTKINFKTYAEYFKLLCTCISLNGKNSFFFSG